MLKSLRLTFNKPTVGHYFKGEEATGVRVKIEDGVVQFLPVNQTGGKDFLPVEVRERGGAIAIVEGTRAAELAEALHNSAGPFFTLERVKGGWLQATPYPKNSAPAKFEPHVRVWVPKEETAQVVRSVAPSVAPATNLPALLQMVRNAQATVAAFQSSKKPGRPPREVLEARQHLEDFRRLAAEIAPVPTVNVALLTEAKSLIERALTGGVAAVDAIAAATETVKVAPPAPEPTAPTTGTKPTPAQAKPQPKAAPAKASQAAPKRATAQAAPAPVEEESRSFTDPSEISDAQVAAAARALGVRPMRGVVPKNPREKRTVQVERRSLRQGGLRRAHA